MIGQTGDNDGSPPAVQVFTLGGFRVVVHGRQVDDHEWRRKTARQLFKALLSHPGRRMTRDQVVERFWPESEPDAAAVNVRSTIHAMRRVLEPARGGLRVVFSDRNNVWLRPDADVWVDADHFEWIVSRAWRSIDPLTLLEEASALHTGQYLPDDVFEEWATERRNGLGAYWAELQLRLAAELEQRGDTDGAVRPLQRLLHVDACDERAARELIQLLARHGRRAEALRVYQRLVEALSEQLDVEPSAETRGLYDQVAAGELPGAIAASFRCAYPFPTPVQLVGRDAEMRALERLLASGRTVGRAAFIGAPPGAGKSALLGALVKKAQAAGVLCLAGGGYAHQVATPLGPFHDALVDYLLAQPADQLRAAFGSSVEDLADVIPEVRHHLWLPDSAAPPIDRTRAFGAIHTCLRTLAERGPVLVCLEDLHAADEVSLQLLRYLARHTRRVPLLLIATYRSDETPPDSALAQTLAAIRREQLAQFVSLAPLNASAIHELLAVMLEGDPSDQFVEWIETTSGGNALFVEQLALALKQTGQLRRELRGAGIALELGDTGAVGHAVIARSLERLSADCRHVLDMCAVLGESIATDDLSVILGDEYATCLDRSLDEALSKGVLRQVGRAYAFRHPLLREALYEELSTPRKMLLHAQAALGLETVYASDPTAHAAELAHHFGKAGESFAVRAKAAHYVALSGGDSQLVSDV